jgi:chorismate mutase
LKQTSPMNLRQEIANTYRPFVIAGPCSAESMEQVDEVVRSLALTKVVKLIRAGVWKPRTRPNSFEGMGDEALHWLMSASQKYGLPVSTEVANAQHVEKALKAGIHVLWLGARTTVNPFTVQEIADALKGVSIPVMVKNPVNPDLELWIGALERLDKAGVSDTVAVHRGFSYYNHPTYRNAPQWEIPIALRERMPNIPMLCDPSHISGKRDLIFDLSQKALDLHFDGLMIEVHNDPSKALSDAQQQLTPYQLSSLLKGLVIREHTVHDNFVEQLNEMRSEVELLDDQLFELLAKRMQHSASIGDFKREHGITILQQEHWKKMIAQRMSQSIDYDLSKEFVRRLMDEIHQESIRKQTKVMNPEKGRLEE